MIQKFVAKGLEIYFCVLCEKLLAKKTVDGYLITYGNCPHYHWEVVKGRKSRKLERKSLIKGHRDDTFYYLLSDIH